MNKSNEVMAQQDEREAGELEPCRWCNQTPRVADDTNLAIHVACKCGVQMWGHRSHFGSQEEAIAAWNRRATQQVQAGGEDKRDAERYRWLRENGNRFFNATHYQGNGVVMDRNVDAARSREQPQPSNGDREG